MNVWIVTRWEFGGGGDDERVILSVHATREGAEAAAPDRFRDEITEHPVVGVRRAEP